MSEKQDIPDLTEEVAASMLDMRDIAALGLATVLYLSKDNEDIMKEIINMADTISEGLGVVLEKE